MNYAVPVGLLILLVGFRVLRARNPQAAQKVQYAVAALVALALVWVYGFRDNRPSGTVWMSRVQIDRILKFSNGRVVHFQAPGASIPCADLEGLGFHADVDSSLAATQFELGRTVDLRIRFEHGTCTIIESR